jgi:hypothetical protein
LHCPSIVDVCVPYAWMVVAAKVGKQARRVAVLALR